MEAEAEAEAVMTKSMEAEAEAEAVKAKSMEAEAEAEAVENLPLPPLPLLPLSWNFCSLTLFLGIIFQSFTRIALAYFNLAYFAKMELLKFWEAVLS